MTAILSCLLAVVASAGRPSLPAISRPAGGTDARPSEATSNHNLSNMWMVLSNVGIYGNPWGDLDQFGMQWPGGEGSCYLYFASIWVSAFGSVTPSGLPGAYVSASSAYDGSFEFMPTEGYPMTKLTPGPTALEESSWGEDDWSTSNDNPLGVRTYQRAFNWATPGYNQFMVNDIVITHLSEHANPGVPLDGLCFSIFAELDIATADPDFMQLYYDDLVFYDGHEIWCNDPDATFDYEFDDGTRASEADNYIYQRNPDASWADPEDDIYYFYNYLGSDGIVDADANSDGVSDHFTILFKVANGDTIYATEPNTGLQLFADGRPPEYWIHTVGDTAYAVVPRNLSYMWDGNRPGSATDDSGEPTVSPPCNGFAGWRLLDFWIRKADGTIERPIDVFGYPVPLSHSWWCYELSPPAGDESSYQVQWGDNQEYSGRHSGPAYLSDWMGDPCAPGAFQPDNPGPFPIVQDNPLALDYQPFDYSFLLTMGPVDLADGDSLHIVGGFVIGRGLADLRQQADNMLDACYRDGGWGVPDIPPVPTLFYEPGDGTVDLIWSDDAESYDPFGGYHLYRSVFNTTDWQLIADIGAGAYAYSDASVTRGFPYYYVLCACDAETGVESPKTNYKQALDGTPIPVVPGWASDADWTETISVVPNPYRGSAEWELPYSDRIAFTHLPPMCDIRIYTLGGDHIVTLQHRSFGGDSGEEYWDLKNSEGRLVTSGLYVYCVQTEDDQAIGKFAIIR